MTTLVVTDESSYAAAAQHPALRAFYGIYFGVLRQVLRRTVRRLARQGAVVVLTNRNLGPVVNQLPGVEVRYYDAVQERLPYRQNRDRGWEIVRAWSSSLRDIPELTVEGVFLPSVFETQLALHLLSGALKYRSILENVLAEVKPEQVVTLSAGSAAEQVVHQLASERRLPTRIMASYGLTRIQQEVDQYLRRREKLVWHQAIRDLADERVATTNALGSVFVVAQQAGHHLKILAPLAKKLEVMGRPTYLLADLGDLGERMRSFTDPPTRWSTIMRYLAPGAMTDQLQQWQSTFRQIYTRARRRWADSGSPLATATTFLENTFRYDFALAAVFIPGIKRMFETLKPTAVITASDRRLNEVLFPMIARQQGVPSILATAITNMSLEMANDYNTCDAIAVTGDYIRDLMVSIGRQPSRVVVVGDLRFDDLPNRTRQFNDRRLREELRLSPERAVVALMSSDIGPTWTESKKRNLFQTVYRTVQQVGQVELVVKAHPNESTDLLRRHMNEWGLSRVPISSRQHLHDVMLLSRVVVMLYSMAGLEAMLLGRPVINVTLEGEDVEHYIPYVTGGGAIGVKTETELAPALSSLLHDQARYAEWVARGKRFVGRFIQPPDGKVSDRILTLIKELEAERTR